MKAFISFQELESIIKEQAEKQVSLSYGGEPDTIQVGYTMSVKVPLLGTKSVTVTACLKLNGVSDYDLDISYSLAKGMDLVLDLITKALNNYIEKTDLASVGKGHNNLILHCDKIAKKAGVDNIDEIKALVSINSLHSIDKGIEADFSLIL